MALCTSEVEWLDFNKRENMLAIHNQIIDASEREQGAEPRALADRSCKANIVPYVNMLNLSLFIRRNLFILLARLL